MTVYVYGASDDLIEIEGDLYEEFCHMSNEPYYLGFSDGTLLKITYDGEWNIKLIEGHADFMNAGRSYYSHVPTHSDLAIIHSDVTWVIGGTDVIK